MKKHRQWIFTLMILQFSFCGDSKASTEPPILSQVFIEDVIDSRKKKKKKRGTSKKQRWVTGYTFQNGFFYNRRNALGYINSSFGLVKDAEDGYHEITLHVGRFNKENAPAVTVDYQGLALQVSYFKSILDIGTSTHVGIKGGLGLLREKQTPNVNSLFETRQTCACVTVSPQLTYIQAINNVLDLNFNISVPLLDLGYGMDEVLNPSIPISAQREFGLGIDVLREYINVKVGLNF